MSLLKDLIENGGGGGGGGAGGGCGAGGAAGATTASAIAGGMFAGGANTSKRRKKANAQNVVGEKPAKPIQMIRRLTKEGSLYGGGIINVTRVKKQQFKSLQRAMSYISEDITGSTDFDAADVVSKLDAAEKKAKLEKDTVTFGLENENGGIVRVYVRSEQADEFETALSQLLAGADNNNDHENTSMEIAEVLFKLKDKFDIVDVNWGDIPEDEEQEQTVGGGAGGMGMPPAQGGAPGMPPPGGAEGGLPPEGGENPIDQAAEEGGEGKEGEGDEDMIAGGGEDDAKSALDSVIDMMKADAKAKQAEAEARAAEARAKEAEWTAKAAAAKVKQEEEVLDMETHEKEKKEMDKEAKRLAKLAKYRHDKANKYRDEMGGSTEVNVDVDAESEEEEQGFNRMPYDPAYQAGPNSKYGKSSSKVSLKQLRDMIYAHLRGDTP